MFLNIGAPLFPNVRWLGHSQGPRKQGASKIKIETSSSWCQSPPCTVPSLLAGEGFEAWAIISFQNPKFPLGFPKKSETLEAHPKGWNPAWILHHKNLKMMLKNKGPDYRAPSHTSSSDSDGFACNSWKGADLDGVGDGVGWAAVRGQRPNQVKNDRLSNRGFFKAHQMYSDVLATSDKLCTYVRKNHGLGKLCLATKRLNWSFVWRLWIFDEPSETSIGHQQNLQW